ncbi:hypothetical protein [Curtobacterium luteum]|uniref:hypothetical protein n=1 Tax=Curtobacterium luteum TaxID=33881 RepID=UPI003811F279
MADTSSVHIATTGTGPRSPWERLRFRWQAEQELHELTRDREREDRVRAEAAVRLDPSPAAFAELFRR